MALCKYCSQTCLLFCLFPFSHAACEIVCFSLLLVLFYRSQCIIFILAFKIFDIRANVPCKQIRSRCLDVNGPRSNPDTASQLPHLQPLTAPAPILKMIYIVIPFIKEVKDKKHHHLFRG